MSHLTNIMNDKIYIQTLSYKKKKIDNHNKVEHFYNLIIKGNGDYFFFY